jgi:hypothetical protein
MRGQFHDPPTLPPRKEPLSPIAWVGGEVGSRTYMDNVERRKILACQDSKSDPLAIQPVATNPAFQPS